MICESHICHHDWAERGRAAICAFRMFKLISASQPLVWYGWGAMLRWPRCQGSGPVPLPVIPRNLDCVHQMPSFRNKTRVALSWLMSVLMWLFSQKPPSVSHSEASLGMCSSSPHWGTVGIETISPPLKIPSDHPTRGRASHRSAGFPFLSRIGCISTLQLSTCSQVWNLTSYIMWTDAKPNY